MPFSLEGRVALVTGASRGIGRATALVLAAAGCDLLLSGRDAALLDDLGGQISGRGRRAVPVVADTTDQESAGLLVRTAQEHFGRLDILVNNAGILHTGPVDRVDDGAWEAVLDTNLTAVFRLCRAAFDPMRAQGWGRIVNIASITAQTGGVSGSVAYSASKGGLMALTRTLSRDGAPHGITVNAVAPGQIDTGMSRAMPVDALQRVTASIPLGRLGLPEDIAYAVLYLASEEASFVTGITLDVNGGILKR